MVRLLRDPWRPPGRQLRLRGCRRSLQLRRRPARRLSRSAAAASCAGTSSRSTVGPAERLSDGAGHEHRVCDRRRAARRTSTPARRSAFRHLAPPQREPRLAGSPRPRQRRRRTRFLVEQGYELGELALPADKGVGLKREVGRVQRPEWRKLAVAELVDTRGRSHVLEPMETEIGDRVGQEETRRLRE